MILSIFYFKSYKNEKSKGFKFYLLYLFLIILFIGISYLMSKFMNIPIFITLIISSIGCIILHIVTFKKRYKVVFNKIEDRFPISLSSSNSYSSTYKNPLKETYNNLKNK